MTGIYKRKIRKEKQRNSISSKLIIKNEVRIEKLENQMDEVFGLIIGKKIKARKEVLAVK